MKFEYEKPVLTETALVYIKTLCRGVIAKDFTGFMIDLRPKYPAIVLITLNGKFRAFSTSPKKGLSEKLYKKINKWLGRVNFIREGYYDPFPEYEEYSNLKLNPLTTIQYNDNIFGEIK